MKNPKLRDSGKPHTHEPYSPDEMPDNALAGTGSHSVHLPCMGKKDIGGSARGGASPDAVRGTRPDSPAGIADVVPGGTARPMNTGKNARPFTAKAARRTGGHRTPDRSHGVPAPRKGMQETGQAVPGTRDGRADVAQGRRATLRTPAAGSGTRKPPVLQEGGISGASNTIRHGQT